MTMLTEIGNRKLQVAYQEFRKKRDYQQTQLREAQRELAALEQEVDRIVRHKFEPMEIDDKKASPPATEYPDFKQLTQQLSSLQKQKDKEALLVFLDTFTKQVKEELSKILERFATVNQLDPNCFYHPTICLRSYKKTVLKPVLAEISKITHVASNIIDTYKKEDRSIFLSKIDEVKEYVEFAQGLSSDKALRVMTSYYSDPSVRYVAKRVFAYKEIQGTTGTTAVYDPVLTAIVHLALTNPQTFNLIYRWIQNPDFNRPFHLTLIFPGGAEHYQPSNIQSVLQQLIPGHPLLPTLGTYLPPTLMKKYKINPGVDSPLPILYDLAIRDFLSQRYGARKALQDLPELQVQDEGGYCEKLSALRDTLLRDDQVRVTTPIFLMQVLCKVAYTRTIKYYKFLEKMVETNFYEFLETSELRQLLGEKLPKHIRPKHLVEQLRKYEVQLFVSAPPLSFNTNINKLYKDDINGSTRKLKWSITKSVHTADATVGSTF